MIFLSKRFLVVDAGKYWAVTDLGNMSDVPVHSHYTWQGTFRPITMDVQVYCCAETSCSNLCKEYCESFQLIFILLLIFPEYSFASQFTQLYAHP
jgi:hypothetical protein